MTVPSEPVAVPELVDRIAAGRPVVAVWENELGGITYAIDDGAEFVKVYPSAQAHLLAAEVPRLRWAGRYTPVPEVLASGPGWLHTARLAGRSAVDPRWADLAIATLSLDWNFPTEGPGGFQEVLLDAYGVAADVERIAYYRSAWDEEDPLAG